MDKKISVIIFGGDVPIFTGGWGPSRGASCGPQSAKEDFDSFASDVEAKYGDKVALKFVDILKDSLDEYPQVKEIMGRFNPPLTVINGEPRFHGGLSVDMISEVIDEINNKQ